MAKILSESLVFPTGCMILQAVYVGFAGKGRRVLAGCGEGIGIAQAHVMFWPALSQSKDVFRDNPRPSFGQLFLSGKGLQGSAHPFRKILQALFLTDVFGPGTCSLPTVVLPFMA